MASFAIPIVRIINVILIAGTVLYWLYVYAKCRTPGFIAPLTWLIDVLAFYVFRLLALGHQSQSVIDLINLWSSVIIAHGIILLFCGAFIIHRDRCEMTEDAKRERMVKELQKELKKQLTRRSDE